MLGLAVCLIFLLPATAVCLGYLVLTLAGRSAVRPQPPTEHIHTFAILIPAHNEETTLPATLRSLAGLDYPADKMRVYVVADNCTDRTAEVARSGGAECLVRTDGEHRGKGFAVASGVGRAVTDGSDVVLILDADCELTPGSLRALDAAFASGAEVAQAAVLSRNADDGPAGYVAAVGAALDDDLAAGRDRLGRSAALRGTGMAFRRSAVGQVRWETASPVEDAEYAAQLRGAGVRVWYCGGAVVWCESPATVGVLCRQRRRWRAASGVGNWARSKPLVLAHLLATGAVCLAVDAYVWWAAILVLLTAGMYLRGMAAVGLTWWRAGLLLASPAVVLQLVGVTLAGLVRGKPTAWDRTPRLGETQAA
ncbi:MAG: icaA [Gemmataceae bacterium]|nr:icaA [Gemmataceae bacterium]